MVTETHDNCKVCQRVLEQDEIKSNNGKRQFKLKSYLGCSVRNLVYAIVCTRCEATVYVGETERTFKERIMEHIKDVEYKRDKAVGKHFNSKNHDMNDLRCAIVERIYDDCSYFRKLREYEWIDKLETRKPKGLNTKIRSSVLWANYKDNNE